MGHCNDARGKSKRKFLSAIRKYGTECWTLEVIEKVSSVELLNEREVYWVAYYNTFHNGYNMRTGGGQCSLFNAEARQHMSESQRRRFTEQGVSDATRQKLREANYKREYGPMREEVRLKMLGWVPSQETRALWSKQRRVVKRGPMSDDTRRKIGAAHRGKKRGPLPLETRMKLSEALRRARAHNK